MTGVTTDPSSTDSIDELLREQLPGLRRFAFWLTRSAADADDLVQATLERALVRWSDRRPDASLRSWLFAILHRRFLDSRRRAQRYAGLLARLLGEEAAQPSAEREAVAASTLEAFARLPVAQRTLLYWVSVEGLSYREVAAILDLPIGTVMSRLSRARAALRKLSEGETPIPRLRLLP